MNFRDKLFVLARSVNTEAILSEKLFGFGKCWWLKASSDLDLDWKNVEVVGGEG